MVIPFKKEARTLVPASLTHMGNEVTCRKQKKPIEYTVNQNED